LALRKKSATARSAKTARKKKPSVAARKKKPVAPAAPRRDPESREMRASRRMMQVTEWELQRILLDIHDGPVQSMYAALSQLEMLRRSLEAPGENSVSEALERSHRIRNLLETGLAEVRQFIGEFRPPEFKQRGLLELLEALSLQHEAGTDTRVMLAVEKDIPEVALTVKIVVYRVMQEALSNAYRHGGAHTVRVTVSRGGPHLVRMTVADDGAGFDPNVDKPDAHYGLKGMRDRVEMIGGRFGISSRPGEGTQIAVEVPLL
jgi:signal transduction histidine kinase